jgi:hypothetical protein
VELELEQEQVLERARVARLEERVLGRELVVLEPEERLPEQERGLVVLLPERGRGLVPGRGVWVMREPVETRELRLEQGLVAA